ncbi:MAG: hypothetical protein U0174_16985 [Polyangiaceae bacterium]
MFGAIDDDGGAGRTLDGDLDVRSTHEASSFTLFLTAAPPEMAFNRTVTGLWPALRTMMVAYPWGR